MTTSRDAVFELGTVVPDDHYRLGGDPESDIVESWGLEVDDDARLSLGQVVGNLQRVVQLDAHPDRLVWVLVRAPGLGRVDAVLTLDVHRVLDDEGIDGLEISIETAPEMEGVIERKVSRRRVGVAEALVVHDFEQGPEGDGGVRRVTERAYVALFPTSDVVLSYRLITQDLMLFEDIVEHLVGIASRATIGASQ